MAGCAAHPCDTIHLTAGVVAVGTEGNLSACNRSGKNWLVLSTSRFRVATDSSSRSLASDSESSSDISNRPGLTDAGEGTLICALALQTPNRMTAAVASS